MTSIMLFRTEDQIITYTDGSAYEPDGIFGQKSTKTNVVLHQPSLIAHRGSGNAARLLQVNCGRHSTFDDMCDNLTTDITAASVGGLLNYGDPINLSVAVGGWSERTGRMEAFTMFFALDAEEKLHKGGLELHPIENSHIEPWPDQALADEVVKHHPDGIDNDFVIEFMEAQRRTKLHLHPGSDKKGCIVGSFIQKTVLTRDQAFTAIIHTWPDELGQKLGRELESEAAE